MANPWFKFYGTEYLADQKVLELTSSERSCWTTLLCYASQDNGTVKNVSETKLMQQAGVDFTKDEWNETIGVLKHFKKLGMVTISNGEITVINWKKRQENALSNAERQARFRERNERITDSNETSNAIVTLDKKKIRIEEDKKERKDEASDWNLKLFQGFKENNIEIIGDPSERVKYPRNMRRKNSDVDFWLNAAKWSQLYKFQTPKPRQEWVYPWRGPIKLSKLYYEINANYCTKTPSKEFTEKFKEMKRSVFGKMAGVGE